MNSGRVWLPNDPSETANILAICGTVAADDLIVARDLEVSPHCFVLQEIADRGELVPV